MMHAMFTQRRALTEYKLIQHISDKRPWIWNIDINWVLGEYAFIKTLLRYVYAQQNKVTSTVGHKGVICSWLRLE